ncbi:MAG: glycosyl transferase group 1 [uncultured bacterium]|nr:MAG: glycosyl transferase group 1 [uncultured bacterium]HBR71341.1 hypothetical protein [Candidatus Moranbacteria bacterium]
MKILEINKYYYPKRGAERHFLDVIKILRNRGNQVAVFSMHHSKNIESPWNKYFLSSAGYTSEYGLWEKIKGALRMFYSWEARKKINKLLDDFQPDVVHIHNIYHQLSPTILFQIKKRNIPIVMTVHDFKLINPNHSMFLNGEFYDRCKDGKFYQCFLDKCVKNSYVKSFLAMLEAYWYNVLGTYRKNIDKYIVPSEFVKNILVERGIGEEKIEVLPHFIFENDLICDEKKSEKKEETYKKPYALYIGALSKNKGVNDLVDIFKNMKGMELCVAGGLEDDFQWENFSNTKYLGFLNRSQLNNVIKKSHCLISGSRLPETFGLIVLEGLSFGKPFFGFKSGAYQEIVENEVNGFLAEKKNELKKALENFSEGRMNFDCEKIKKSARQIYGKEAYFGKLEKIFEIEILLTK